MPNMLIADFDALWYQMTYPDVAMTGMDPTDHFLRFGRLLGRRPHATSPPGAPLVPLATRAEDGLTAQPVPAEGQARPQRPGPIIDRPVDFDPATLLLRTAPALPTETRGLGLDGLSRASFVTPEAARALVTYAALFHLPVPGHLVGLGGAGGIGAVPFQSGALRIESLWLPTGGMLRLRLAGSAGPLQNTLANRCTGWTLRAYQARANAPAAVMPVGDGLVLPADGPVLWDVPLLHPLMPVLVQATDRDGAVQATALLAFPSLVPGGLHASESKASQSSANPMDALWALTERLVHEKLGQLGWAAPAVTGISVCLRGATGGEPLFAAPMLDWLETLFSLWLAPADANAVGLTLGEGDLQTMLRQRCRAQPPGSRADAGVTLSLPKDAVPSLSALVSRRLDDGCSDYRAGAYLVAEDFSLRPRWMVTPPPDAPRDPTMPALIAAARALDTALAPAPVPIPIAVLFRPQVPPHATRLLLPTAPSRPGPAHTPIMAPLVVLTASDPVRTEDLLRSLLALTSAPEVVVRMAGHNKVELRAALDPVLGVAGWREVAVSADLRHIAGDSSATRVLTLDDRVVLHDPETLPALAALLDATPDAASASCLLLGERVVKKQGVLQPAVGGLFPSRVSFATAPALGFHEPDTFQPLPNAIYPVAANTLLLSLWRREILASLPLPQGPVPATAIDITLGLDALAAGYRNLCSSKVRAGVLGDLARRDEIDPVGTQSLRPGQWEDLLSRVTVLRELF